MSTSRRNFFMGLAATTAVATTTSLIHAAGGAVGSRSGSGIMAAPEVHGGLEMKIGYSAIAWNDHDAAAMDDLTAMGVPGIQLRANVVKDFPDPHVLRDMLARHHLTFVALSSGFAPIEPADRKSTINAHVENAKYLREAGGKYLQIVAAPTKGRSFSAQDFNYEGQLLTDIAKPVADLGIQTSLHNHMGTMAQTPQNLDAILAAADARYVKLELDTAHYLQGGGDPAGAVRQYRERLLFLHLKDVKDAPTQSGYEFTELGRGRVDFPALFAALESIHFHGWGVIELDGQRLGTLPTPRESAEISKKYLAGLGIRV